MYVCFICTQGLLVVCISVVSGIPWLTSGKCVLIFCVVFINTGNVETMNYKCIQFVWSSGIEEIHTYIFTHIWVEALLHDWKAISNWNKLIGTFEFGTTVFLQTICLYWIHNSISVTHYVFRKFIFCFMNLSKVQPCLTCALMRIKCLWSVWWTEWVL
jgi:hypothetical protein